MVVMVGEKIRYTVRADESARFVKGECAGRFARTDEHGPVVSSVVLRDVAYQCPCVSLSLVCGQCGEVLQFAGIGCLFGYHADAFETAVVQCEQFAPVKVKVDHVLLFVGQQ